MTQCTGMQSCYHVIYIRTLRDSTTDVRLRFIASLLVRLLVVVGPFQILLIRYSLNSPHLASEVLRRN
jgi:hypothetical protein